jgi:hypothetical protein
VDLPRGVEIYGANMAFAAAPLRAVGGFSETLGRVGDRPAVRRGGRGGGRPPRPRATARSTRARRRAAQHPARRLRPGWLLSRLLWQGATDALRDRAGSNGRARLLGAAARLLVQAPLLLWPATSPALLRARCGAAYNLGYLRGRSRGPLTRAETPPPRRAVGGAVARFARRPSSALARPRDGGPPLRERLAALRLGANIERGSRSPATTARGGWGLRVAGLQGRGLRPRPHVRPEVGQTGDGMEIPDLFRGAVADATAAGLPVLLGLSDFIKHAPRGRTRVEGARGARRAVRPRHRPRPRSCSRP